MTAGFLTARDLAVERRRTLRSAGAARVARPWSVRTIDDERAIWVAAERLPEFLTIHPNALVGGHATLPPARAARTWTPSEAIVEVLRGRLALAGPTTAAALAASCAISEEEANAALLILEGEGLVLRGTFTAAGPTLEWCDRRLLARIHRYTLNRLRAEIEPVSPADFMRFLFAWQHADPSTRLTGLDGLRAIVAMLDGFELAANAWERDVLPARMDRYERSMLDMLCLTGEVGWMRVSPPDSDPRSRVIGATPVALFLREHGDLWRAVRDSDTTDRPDPIGTIGETARAVYQTLNSRGASFLRDLAPCATDHDALVSAVGELVAAGLVTSDGFDGLRTIVAASAGRRPARSSAMHAGRWSLLGSEPHALDRDAVIEAQARALLRRYGVVFRRVLSRETNVAPWRDLARVYRRLEARGEIRGGRFVSGMSGEQFALSEAVERLREIRRTPPDNRTLIVSAADPLNLTGIITLASACEPSRGLVWRTRTDCRSSRRIPNGASPRASSYRPQSKLRNSHNRPERVSCQQTRLSEGRGRTAALDSLSTP